METRKIWLFHKAGAWILAILGMGHILTSLLSPRTAAQEEMLHQMSRHVIQMPGWDSTLLLFYQGFSLMMGLLLIAHGALNLAIAGAMSHDVFRMRRIAILNTFISLVTMGMSFAYFFLVPVVFSLASLIAYAVFLGLIIQHDSQSRGKNP